MKKILRLSVILLFACCLGLFNFVGASAQEEKLYLGGMSAGFSLTTKGADIVGLCDVISENGIASPAKEANLAVGDVILTIDGKETDCAEDIAKNINGGGEKLLKVERKGEILDFSVTPAKDLSGNYRLGVFIRDRVNGIGTITYIKGDRFASLGHPVMKDEKNLLNISGGELVDCAVSGCVKGERGFAGELKGIFTGEKIGKITKNTQTGVYGTLNEGFDFSQLREIEVGEGVMGDASIFSTVNGNGVKEYKISIIKADLNSRGDKNFVVKITDDALIKETGGIVQGMSGSPIVQNGKIVGAITHVFINDPTRGFGISIDNMLKNQ